MPQEHFLKFDVHFNQISGIFLTKIVSYCHTNSILLKLEGRWLPIPDYTPRRRVFRGCSYLGIKGCTLKFGGVLGVCKEGSAKSLSMSHGRLFLVDIGLQHNTISKAELRC